MAVIWSVESVQNLNSEVSCPLHNSKIDIYIDWKVETQGYFVVAKKNEIFYLK